MIFNMGLTHLGLEASNCFKLKISKEEFLFYLELIVQNSKNLRYPKLEYLSEQGDKWGKNFRSHKILFNIRRKILALFCSLSALTLESDPFIY